ncbi:hypothetical protein BDQ12DRAFT_608750 [Crucibulum laeve]|uniref:Guanine nucleotide-binding protein-like 1 n=1 Tax=Crucibulum laeve TaxID=68775 RepID=A0A5C3M758_9AGAR|nr:hypothetical protein BDQ12DRAFT_608750 [Crucibulum laeve]
MPPRKKPTSTKQKKAEQQLKRAIKRGDVPPPDPKKPQHRKPNFRRGPTGHQIGSSSDPATIAAVDSARKLQSAFIKLPPHFLEKTKSLASLLPLPRPLSNEAAIYVDAAAQYAEAENVILTCPRRPKWRFDMTKTEVERNEEGVYKKWLAETDELIEKWQNHASPEPNTDTESSKPPTNPEMPASPSYFERNLEVWRQLWRVTEISQIILVLLDSRCPTLHYPPSLATYLADRKVILVLTKVDITGTARVQAWTDYFHQKYPNLRVVQVESYIEKEARAEHQGRKQYEPHIPENFRQRLVETIKELHSAMRDPPEKVRNNPKWLAQWTSPVKRDINWEAVLTASGDRVGIAVGGAAVRKPDTAEESVETEREQEPEVLTVGLLGQPNVGKSSLLNALFGARKVRASKTPGKTKHFQTLYWTSDVRIVDCPGLVMPNFIPMELQVLSGILPISRVSAIPSCIHYAACKLPVERIYKLTHPSTKLLPIEDKRTWRDGMKSEVVDTNKPLEWTAMDILTAYADAKGWVTAKAGRLDVHRAGNAMLRALAEGKVTWAFWPPNTAPEKVATESSGGLGIWIPSDIVESEYESEEEEEADDKHESERSSENELLDEEDEDEVEAVGIGRFGALMVQEDDGEEEEEEDSEA